MSLTGCAFSQDALDSNDGDETGVALAMTTPAPPTAVILLPAEGAATVPTNGVIVIGLISSSSEPSVTLEGPAGAVTVVVSAADAGNVWLATPGELAPGASYTVSADANWGDIVRSRAFETGSGTDDGVPAAPSGFVATFDDFYDPATDEPRPGYYSASASWEASFDWDDVSDESGLIYSFSVPDAIAREGFSPTYSLVSETSVRLPAGGSHELVICSIDGAGNQACSDIDVTVPAAPIEGAEGTHFACGIAGEGTLPRVFSTVIALFFSLASVRRAAQRWSRVAAR